MNTELDENFLVETDKVHPRTPERWMLVGPDPAWCERICIALAEHAERLPKPSFLAWRLQHGLICVLDTDHLDAALTLALVNSPNAQGVQRNATRIWAALSEEAWYASTSNCAALRTPSARGLNVTLLSADDSPEANDDLHDFMRSADMPDALPRLTWLMNQRPMPVPRDWLSLAPLPELTAASNKTMAEDGYRCYAAWAEAMLANSAPGELRELWGTYPDNEANQSDEDAQIIHLDEHRKPPKPHHMEPQDLVPSLRLAASCADSAASDPVEPVHTLDLEPAVSRGVSHLEAFVHAPASESSPPRIEFVASWILGNYKQEQTKNLSLVLTLSKRKPMLLKGRVQNKPSESVNGAAFSMSFGWPQNSQPQDVPKDWTQVANWLRTQLKLARVSLL